MATQRRQRKNPGKRMALATPVALLLIGAAQAQTPPPAAQFQQVMQQQRLSDQLQKSQQQTQQQQNVSNVAGKVLTQGSTAQQALERANRAQQDTAAARERDAVDRHRAKEAQEH